MLIIAVWPLVFLALRAIMHLKQESFDIFPLWQETVCGITYYKC